MISRRHKDKEHVVQHISDEEVDQSDNENAQPTTKPSVFDRLQSFTSKKRPSLFIRIGEGQNPKKALCVPESKRHAQPKPSVFNIINKRGELLKLLSRE